MIDFELTITHTCGHVQTHKGGSSSGDSSWLEQYFAKQKCSHCRPTCEFCHRSGDRESMLVTETGSVFCNSWCFDQSQHQTRYREHNDIAIPNRLRHWRDDSYHNDLCGRSAYELGNGDEICIWVQPEDPQEREDPSLDRFTAVFCPGGELDCDLNPLYEGESEPEMELWAHAAEIVRCGSDDDDDAAATPKVKAIQALMAASKEKTE